MRNLADLKKLIRNKKVSDDLIIFKCSDNNFIALEYTNAIANIKELEIMKLDDFDDNFSDSQDNLFDFLEIDYLRLFMVDEFTTKNKDLSELKNVVVICNKIDSKVKDVVDDYVCEIPKLENWQIEDYLKTSCQGLSQDKVKWLCESANYDIYRLHNEASKINCFDKKYQNDVFDMIDADDGYSDMIQTKIFDFCNAIVSKNLQETNRLIKNIKDMSIEPYALVGLLRNNFILIYNIQTDSNATAVKLNIKPVQFNILKSKSCGKFSEEKLRQIIEFMSNFDYMIKTGSLDISKEKIIDYIICEVLS